MSTAWPGHIPMLEDPVVSPRLVCEWLDDLELAPAAG
jgi:hypothetical protein